MVDGKRKVILRTVSGHIEEYDHVIMASHSGTTLKILENGGQATPEEKAILGGFQWTHNPTVLHSDTSVGPYFTYEEARLSALHPIGVACQQEGMVRMELRYGIGASDRLKTW